MTVKELLAEFGAQHDIMKAQGDRIETLRSQVEAMEALDESRLACIARLRWRIETRDKRIECLGSLVDALYGEIDTLEEDRLRLQELLNETGE